MRLGSAVFLPLVVLACGSGTAARPAEEPAATDAELAAFDAAFRACTDNCLASHCADGIGGGCFHVCNLNNYGEVDDPVAKLRSIAERYAAMPACPFVEVTEGPTPAGLVTLGEVECRGDYCGVVLLDEAAAKGANLITNYQCRPLGSDELDEEWDDETVAQDGEHQQRCTGQAAIDPTRVTFEGAR